MPTSSLLAAVPLIDNPFFLIGDLPVHTLVVHFAVVMLPLSAVALIAIILVPKWRGAFVWAAMVGLLIGTGAAFVSKESGEQLAERIGQPATHAKWGDILPIVAVVLLLVAALWLWLEYRSSTRRSGSTLGGSGLQKAVGVVAIVVAVIAMGLTVVVGHTGAAAVWASRSLDTESTEDTPQTGATTAPSTGASGSAAASGPTYTLADVAGHATAADCWSVVSGGVYNLTDWIPQHPGGSGVIEAMCGIDGTASYDGQHKGQASPAKALAAYEIGTLGAASAAGTQSSAAAVASPAAPTASPAAGSITISDVAKHSTATDCWSAVSGGVYDLTAWIPQHPGGSGVIEAMCGSDGTAAYNSQHKGQSTPNKVLAGFQIGTLG